MALDKVTLFCFLASYTVALAVELSQFVRRSFVAQLATMLFTLAGFVAHTSYLLARSQQHDLPPLLSSTHDWVLVSAWLAVALYLGIQLWSPRLSVGIFALPLVLILVGIAPFTSRTPIPQVFQMHWWTMSHAAAYSLGIVGVLLALLVSLMYLIQHHRLKQKRSELPALHLVSLERLSQLNWWLIIVSVPLQTLGMITGLYMIHLSKSGDHPVDLMSITVGLNALVWIAMTILFGWMLADKNATGRLVAWRTILACVFLLFTLLVLKLGSADAIHGQGHAPFGHSSLRTSGGEK
ncbi:MAG TPA: hypothetical protein VNQ76_21875 [Planctomicrobium sp.]|nr:hypothetical protein [Planctomicrobium sp.]